MTELGNRLKEARLAKGLSLEDLQTMTKIQKRYLIGIEEGDYSSMPGNFYVRAFVKQYAEALLLDVDEIFELYKADIPATHNENLPDQLSRVKTHKTITEGNSKVFDILPKVLIGIFLIGAAGLLYYFLTNNIGDKANDAVNKDIDPVKIVRSEELDKADEKKKEQTEEAGKDEAEQQKQEDTPPPAVKQELTVVEGNGSNSIYDLKNADKFEVRLVSKGNTWVGITNSKGKSLFGETLSTKPGGTPSQTVDLLNESNVVIRVGNTIDTDIFVNDQKLEYAVAPTEEVVQNITIQYVPKNE